MSMRPLAMGGIALLLFFGLSAGTAVAAPPDSAAQSDTLSCGDCHDQAKVFTGNIHARGKVVGGVVPNAVCESCHGNGAAHIEGGGDKTKITKPAGRAGSELCLTCHDKPTDQMTRHAGMHSNSETVNCLTCHSVHASDPMAQHLLVKTPTELCSSLPHDAGGIVPEQAVRAPSGTRGNGVHLVPRAARAAGQGRASSRRRRARRRASDATRTSGGRSCSRTTRGRLGIA